MDEVNLLRRRQSIVGELANVPPMGHMRIRIAQTVRDGQRMTGELTEQLSACTATANLCSSGRLKVAA
jgi:hypothetical protein